MTQTILIVEDNPQVLEMVRVILTLGGSGKLIEGGGAPHRLPDYEVLVADSAAEGLRIGLESPTIHLLLADVVLPGMRGDQLAEKLKRVRPDMRVLLMSGRVTNLEIFDGRWQFLAKPFEGADLLARVAAELGKAEAGAGGGR
jgi:two-component system cell cycle sensor histidine kinase/response regulator CckA